MSLVLKKLKGTHSGLLCVVLKEAGGGTDPQVSPSIKTTAPGNLAEVQLYCPPGGTLARAAGNFKRFKQYRDGLNDDFIFGAREHFHYL